MYSLLIIIYSLLFILLSLRRLDWAVMFLIAALPSYLIRFQVVGLPVTLLELMIWVVFITWFLDNRSRICFRIKCKLARKEGGEQVSNYPFRIEIVLMLLISLVAVGIGGFSNAAFGIWKAYFFEPILLYIVVFNVIVKKERKGLETILWPLLISALAVSLLALYQKMTGLFIDNPSWAAESTRRAVSFFGYPNAVGLYLAPLVVIFIGWIKHIYAEQEMNISKKTVKIVSVLAVTVLSTLAIIFAKSAGAIIGIVAGLALFGLLANKKSRLAILGIFFIAAIFTLSYEPAWQSAYGYLSLNDFSGQLRKSQWDETWKMLKDGKLITGAGLANYQKAVTPFHHEGIWIKDVFDPNWLQKVRTDAAFREKAWQPLEIYLYPHDIFLNFWSELGLAGMFLFIWMIGKYLYIGISAYFRQDVKFKYIMLGLTCAMIVIAVHGLVDVPYFKNDLSAMFWVMMALMGVLSLANKTPQPL